MADVAWLSAELLRDMDLLRREDLSADPVLACAFSVPVWLQMAAETWAGPVVAKHWSEEARQRIFGPAPLPADLACAAAITLYTNTMALHGLLLPRVSVRERRARMAAAERCLADFLAQRRLVPVVRLFCATRAYEHGRALAFYRRMTEGDFTSGRFHVPAHPDYGYGDLLYGVINGWLRIEMDHGVGGYGAAPAGVRLSGAGESLATWWRPALPSGRTVGKGF